MHSGCALRSAANDWKSERSASSAENVLFSRFTLADGSRFTEVLRSRFTLEGFFLAATKEADDEEADKEGDFLEEEALT